MSFETYLEEKEELLLLFLKWFILSRLQCKPGDSNLAIEFKNLDDNKLYLNYSYTEAEVTEVW